MREKETTDLERARAQEALLKQQEDVENYAKEIENQKNAHSTLEARIQAMEGKVGCIKLVLKASLKCELAGEVHDLERKQQGHFMLRIYWHCVCCLLLKMTTGKFFPRKRCKSKVHVTGTSWWRQSAGESG